VKRAVIDTNVLVSGLLRPDNPPGRILDMVLAGELQPVFDDRILREYRQVLRRPRFHFHEGAVMDLMDYLEHFGWLLAAPGLAVRLPDPKDLMFLEVAAKSLSLLITGNTRHFPQHVVDVVGLQILSPSEILKEYL
jgi:putative PIN family toxin of toxin-antitoxin system